MTYIKWRLLRIIYRLLAYVILLPIMLAMCPFVIVWDYMGAAYYKLKEW